MNIKEIKELIEAVSEKGITELEVERAGVKVRIRKEAQPTLVTPTLLSSGAAQVTASLVPPVIANNGTVPAAVAPPESALAGREDLYVVRSPIVGTFYRAPTPSADPFVQVGDAIEPGRVLCIIEAMKLMNEIEAEVGGDIANIYVENGEPVEFGQALFGIRPAPKP